MGMSDDRTAYRLPGINEEIACRAIETLSG